MLRYDLLVLSRLSRCDMLVAQRGIGPLSIRSRVNQPPEVSDGNFRDEKPTDITDVKTRKIKNKFNLI